MVSPRRAQSTPLHVGIHEELKDRILRGELAAGSALNEAELARLWGVSRTPVREALRQLEQEGLVTVAQWRGATVVGLTLVDIRDSAELRARLEGLAARLAASRASDDQIARIAELATGVERAQRERDFDHAAALDHALHHEIAEGSGNELLESMVDRVLDRVRMARALTRMVPGGTDDIRREHEAIVVAITAHEPDEAERAIVDHVAGARRRLIGLLGSEAGSSGTPVEAAPADPPGR